MELVRVKYLCIMNLPFKIKEMGIDLKVPAWFVDSECKYPALGREVS